MNCEFCNKPTHVWFQCPSKPDGWKPARLVKKSTAARKDVPGTEGTGQSLDRLMVSSPLIIDKATPVAGTQALPVDTKPSGTTRSRSSTGQSHCVAGSKPVVSEPEGQPIPKRSRGRPRTITDMKVYKAMKQREYRERKKNEA